MLGKQIHWFFQEDTGNLLSRMHITDQTSRFYGVYTFQIECMTVDEMVPAKRRWRPDIITPKNERLNTEGFETTLTDARRWVSRHSMTYRQQPSAQELSTPGTMIVNNGKWWAELFPHDIHSDSVIHLKNNSSPS